MNRSVSAFACELMRSTDSRDAAVWKLAAFLGRYAHQPLDQILSRPVKDMYRLASAIAEMLEAETPKPGG